MDGEILYTDAPAGRLHASAADLVDTLMSVSQMLVAIAARSLNSEDLTLPQFRALVVLLSRGPLRPGDLALELQVDPSTATRLCDRLSRRSLIVREHSRTDRRAIELALTAKGRLLVTTVWRRRRQELEHLVGTLSLPAEQHEVLTGALRALLDAAGADPAQWKP